MANKNFNSIKFPGLTPNYVVNQIAAEFSTSTSYAVGDYCNYLGQIYKCTTAHSGAWDASDFTAVYIADEVASGSSVTVDSALSSSSENPVQNKVIYSALEDKADAGITRNNTATTSTASEGDQLTIVSSVTTNADGQVTGTNTDYITLPSHPTYTTPLTYRTLTPAVGDTVVMVNGFRTSNGHVISATVDTVTIPSDSSKQDVLTFDSTPTSGSTNPVTSGGVYTALEDKADANITRTDTTSSASPSAGGTVTMLDSVTTNSDGQVTAVNVKTVTLPSTSVTVDSAMSASSTNPVQNAVIYTALADKQDALTATTATLAVASWSSSSITVTVSGVTASNTVIVTPAPSSVEDYTDAGIICTAQAADALTFTCDTTPTSAITVNVLII